MLDPPTISGGVTWPVLRASTSIRAVAVKLTLPFVPCGDNVPAYAGAVDEDAVASRYQAEFAAALRARGKVSVNSWADAKTKCRAILRDVRAETRDRTVSALGEHAWNLAHNEAYRDKCVARTREANRRAR